MATVSKQQVWIKVIEVVGTVLVAVLTTLGTLFGASSKVEGTKQTIQSLPEVEKIANLPIGSIVPSTLAPHQFYEAVGDSALFVPDKNRWVLADGQVEIGASRYGKLLQARRVPDLRGMFLRGLNEGRTDGDPNGANRRPGDRQEDATRMPPNVTVSEAGAHAHTLPAGGDENGWGHAEIGGGGQGGPLTSSSAGAHAHTVGGGDVETRPKNVAVFYYIKVN